MLIGCQYYLLPYLILIHLEKCHVSWLLGQTQKSCVALRVYFLWTVSYIVGQILWEVISLVWWCWSLWIVCSRYCSPQCWVVNISFQVTYCCFGSWVYFGGHWLVLYQWKIICCLGSHHWYQCCIVLNFMIIHSCKLIYYTSWYCLIRIHHTYL